MGRIIPGCISRIVPRSLLFNIYLNDLLTLVDFAEVYNLADGNSSFACDKSLGSLINTLEHDSLFSIE